MKRKFRNEDKLTQGVISNTQELTNLSKQNNDLDFTVQGGNEVDIIESNQSDLDYPRGQSRFLEEIKIPNEEEQFLQVNPATSQSPSTLEDMNFNPIYNDEKKKA